MSNPSNDQRAPSERRTPSSMAASVASAGASPLSGYSGLLPADSSNPDTDESWAFLDVPSGSTGSAPASLGFLTSPGASGGSLGSSYAVVGPFDPSPPALSPLYLDVDSQGPFATAVGSVTASEGRQQQQQVLGNVMGSAGNDAQFTSPQEWVFTEQQLNDLSQFVDTFTAGMGHADLAGLEQSLQGSPELDIATLMRGDPHVSPWDPTGMRQDDGVFVMEGFTPPAPAPASSVSVSPPLPASATPFLPGTVKQEAGRGKTTPSPIRRVRGAGARVGKKTASEHSASSMSGSGSSSPNSKFVIVTPNSISAAAGKPNPFECFEAMRPSQKGRKGPLADATKESALQVRRLGACFCCHARKVKCDKERPCRGCKKLMVQVPQVVCWQFQDFLTILFPDFIRGHLRKEEISKFVAENVETFTVGGVEQPCTVELFSGMLFRTKLTIRAKFFTAKTLDILRHYHLNVGAQGVDLQAQDSLPIGLDTEGNSQKDDIKKKVKEYIHGIINEPGYAEQVTDALRSTQVPRKVLQIVQAYAQSSDSPLVKKALSIYAMHYVLTRHLCLTRQTIASLQPSYHIGTQWVTPRMLNRQIKAVVDEQMTREMTAVFDGFSRSLKPKSRREWAPCLAAFLVLCLFMEAIETAADNFVLSQNEISMRERRKPQQQQQPPLRRQEALRLNQEVENMPFKQFAYQFHQIYQTHTRDASAKSFNPLVGDGLMEAGDLDGPTLELVLRLRQLLDETWDELDFLTMDPMLGNGGDHPWPMDVAQNYTGRLVSKFLLSFTSENYIFDSGA